MAGEKLLNTLGITAQIVQQNRLRAEAKAAARRRRKNSRLGTTGAIVGAGASFLIPGGQTGAFAPAGAALGSQIAPALFGDDAELDAGVIINAGISAAGASAANDQRAQNNRLNQAILARAEARENQQIAGMDLGGTSTGTPDPLLLALQGEDLSAINPALIANLTASVPSVLKTRRFRRGNQVVTEFVNRNGEVVRTETGDTFKGAAPGIDRTPAQQTALDSLQTALAGGKPEEIATALQDTALHDKDFQTFFPQSRQGNQNRQLFNLVDSNGNLVKDEEGNFVANGVNDTAVTEAQKKFPGSRKVAFRGGVSDRVARDLTTSVKAIGKRVNDILKADLDFEGLDAAAQRNQRELETIRETQRELAVKREAKSDPRSIAGLEGFLSQINKERLLRNIGAVQAFSLNAESEDEAVNDVMTNIEGLDRDQVRQVVKAARKQIPVEAPPVEDTELRSLNVAPSTPPTTPVETGTQAERAQEFQNQLERQLRVIGPNRKPTDKQVVEFARKLVEDNPDFTVADANAELERRGINVRLAIRKGSNPNDRRNKITITRTAKTVVAGR